MDKPQQHIGRFAISRLLGRGAQSAVYLAYDPHLEREVAIKTLHLGASDPERNRLLLAEARTVSKLHHAHIVPIFEAGEEEGDPYLVFEYVEGPTLAELIRREGRMLPPQAARLIRAVLDAIGLAHRAGIVHRDLKPSNILMDSTGNPRVMDFGIASRVDGTAIVEDGSTLQGTPIYMSPEYVTRRVVGPAQDLYAAGLILYELVYGRRAILADTVPEALRQVATQPVTLPADPPLPEPFRQVLARAVAYDPALRFDSAESFIEALNGYLQPAAATQDSASHEATNSTLEFLLRHMRHKSDFPALSTAIAAINRIASSEKESLGALSNAILKDFALTNKILRVVNSPYYRAAAGGTISTVSRAIVVLGFNTIRGLAVSLILFEHMQNKAHASLLQEEFVRANLCGMFAKTLANGDDGEEAFLCALFHHLGRLLTQYYFPEEAEAIRSAQAQDNISEDAAAARVLGIGYQDLAIGIARHWGFPETLVHGMRRLPEGRLPPAVGREERLRLLAGLASEMCALIEQNTPERRARELPKLVTRYADATGINERRFQAVLDHSRQEIDQFAKVVHIDLKQTRIGRRLLSLVVAETPAADAEATTTLVMADALLADRPTDEVPGASTATLTAPDPATAQAILAAGIQDISDSLVEGFRLNDLLEIILETMYRAMGFQRVVLCVRDPKSRTMNARFGLGEDVETIVAGFKFPLGAPTDVFNLALAKGADILISDALETRIVGSIPEWYRRAVAAPTFMVFPLVIKNIPVALIYADKDRAGDLVVSERELSLLRTLRNQAILAIKQSG